MGEREGMKRLAGLVLSAIAMLFFSPTIRAQERPILAVFEIESRGSGLKRQSLLNLTDYMAAKLAECGFQVIPREQIRQRLVAEKRVSYKKCFDRRCQIELGRELAAQKILSSQVLKIGGVCKITSTVYDLKRAAAEGAATGGGRCSEADLLAAIERITLRHCGIQQQRSRIESEAAVRARSDFDEVLRRAQKIKERKERTRKAWETVRQMARDEQLPVKTRAELVRKFLEEFRDDNPYAELALALLRDLLPARLVVDTSVQGAEIILDGKTVGRAPVALRLKAGNYRVSAIHEGHKAEERLVELEPGGETRVTIVLTDIRPGELVVSSVPKGTRVVVRRGSEVLASGADEQVIRLEPGEYDVEVLADDHLPKHKMVSLVRGERKRLSFVLQKLPPGRLEVKTEPEGADVLVDGVLYGQAPVVINLNAGIHRISAQKEGFTVKEQEVVLEAGKERRVTIVMTDVRPGEVVVNSKPMNTQVLVRRGQKVIASGSGGQPILLEPGVFDVEVLAAGYVSEKRQVYVVRGSRTEFSLVLKKIPPGRLQVKTEPEGAEVLVNGKPAGCAPVTLELKPGTYRISAVKEGFAATEKKVKLEAGKGARVSITMIDKRPGRLVVKIIPSEAWFVVRKGMKVIGAYTTGKTVELDPGKYDVVVRSRGYMSKNFSITIIGGKQKDLSVKLKKLLTSVLVVKATPPGAAIFINGVKRGIAPVEINLKPGTHRIEAKLDGYITDSKKIDIQNSGHTEVSFSLSRSSPISLNKILGGIIFFGGVGLTVYGGVSASQGPSNNVLDWGAILSLGGGMACAVGGILLWLLPSGDNKGQEKKDKSVSLGPMSDGAMILFNWHW